MHNANNQGQLQKDKQWVAILSGIVNSILVLIKFVVGLYSGSVSMISEAAHSLVDLMASAIAYIAVKKSGKPADQEHAYGHGKVENLSGAFEAFLVVIAGAWIVYEAVQKFSSGHMPEYLDYGIMVMLVSVLANLWIARKLYKVAKESGSSALEADALHHAADVWTSVGVLAGLAIIKFTGMYWLDPVIAIIVAAIIFKAGYTMTKDNLNELMDIRLPKEDEEMIIKTVKSHEEVIDIHCLRTRKSGSNRLIDMHLVLRKDMHINEASSLYAEIEMEIKKNFASCDIMMKIESYDESPENSRENQPVIAK